jgi:hypothetical protein
MNKPINLIGIAGKKGSGKNTVATIIQKLAGSKGEATITGHNGATEHHTFWHWEQKSFAAKLKQIASILTSIPVEKFEDQKFKESFLDINWNYWKEDADDTYLAKLQVRGLLQKLGTEVGRNIHPEVWVNALFTDYKIQNPVIGKTYSDLDLPKWIITDVRFPNEAQAIRDRGGIVVRVHREGLDTSDTHPSETALDNYICDAIIPNFSTIESLSANVKHFLQHYKIIE